VLIKIKNFLIQKLDFFWDNPIMKRIITNSAILFSANGLKAILSVIQGVLIFRVIGLNGTGLLATITSFTNSANRLASFRINEFVVKYVREFEEKNQPEKAAAAFKLAILFELIGAIIAVLLINYFALWGANVLAKDWAHIPNLSDWFIAYSVVALLNFMYDSASGLLQVFNRFNRIAQISVIQGVLSLLLVIWAFYINASIPVFLAIYIFGKLILSVSTTTLAIIAATKHWGKQWLLAPISSLWPQKKDILTFVISTNVSGSISLVAKDSESLWISGFLDTTATGFYNIALKFIVIMQMPVIPLSSTTYPELTREISNRNWDAVIRTLKKGSLLAGLYTGPLILGLIIFGKFILKLMYGIKSLPAYPILVILLIGYLFSNVFFWNRIALLALNRPAYLTTVNFIGMVIKVVGIVIYVPIYGVLLFAALLSGYYIFTVSLAVIQVRRELLNNLASVESR
jgi:O-antigen/teichoic acid export membrane protein